MAAPVRRARSTGPSWTRRPWLPSWSAPPGPSWSGPTRAPLGSSWSCPTRAHHGAELELSDVGATGPSWSCPTRAPPPGAEQDAATVAAVLARITGPSWSCPPRAHHRGRAGAVRRAPRTKLELSDVHAHQRAELDAATMAAVLARAPARTGAVRRARAPPGPSWSCPTCARATGAELELSDVRAHHRAELELSAARTTGPSWSCPPRAPPGPRWSCPPRAPPGPERAPSAARIRAELAVSDARTPGPERAPSAARTPGAELALSDLRTPGAELELPDVGAQHRAELGAATMAAVLARATGPSWTRRAWLPSWRATGPSWSCPARAPPGPSWSCPTCAPRPELELSDARAPARAGAVRRGRHGPELELSGARPGPSWTRRRWLPSWRAPGPELELSDARAPHRAKLELCDVGATGPSWTRRPWLQSWRAPRGRAGAVRRGRHRGRAGAVRRARPTGPELDAATMAAVLARHRAELELSTAHVTGAELELSDVRAT